MLCTTRAARAATTTAALLGAALLTTPVAAAPSPGAATTASDARPVSRIYVSLPRQGKAAASAALVARGLRTAVEDRGGVAGGRRIQLVWMDDARGETWDAARVVANARRAAADPAAIAYVGEGGSAASELSMPIVNRAGLAHLSPVSTATELTSDAKAATLQPTGVRTFFRPVADDARQGAALASYVRRSKAGGRVLLVDDGGVYGRGLTSAFTAAGAGGATVLGRRVVDPSGRGIAALARRVRAERPTAVVYGGTPSSDAGPVIRAVHRASPRTLVFGGEALAHDSFAKELGADQSVVRLTATAAHVSPRARTGRGLGRRPDAFAVLSHNGMTALLRAVDRAGRGGTVTRASVRDAVFDGRLQKGLSGAWSITPEGDSTYGVFDALRLAGDRVRTPIDRATERLVRRVRSGRPGAARSRGADAGGVTAPAHAGLITSTGVEQAALASGRLRAAPRATDGRTLAASFERYARLGKIRDALLDLRQFFPADAAPASTTLRDGLPQASIDGLRRDVLRLVLEDGGLGRDPALDAFRATFRPLRKGEVDGALARIVELREAVGTALHLKSVRAQTATNEQNAAAVVTSAVAKATAGGA